MIDLYGPETFPGCFWLDYCKIYGVTGKPDHVINCTAGIDNRTIYCERGYHILNYEKQRVSYPTYLQNITIIGYENFDGCYPFCGDGVVTPDEQCDDGNAVSGDGCSACKVDPGFFCGEEGKACCFAGPYYNMLVAQMKLVCMDGWWMSPTADRVISFNGFSSNTTAKRADDTSSEVVMSTGYLKLCGPVNITQTLEISKDAQLFIAGPLSVNPGGVIKVHTGMSVPLVVVREPCSSWDAPAGHNLADSGFVVNQDGQVTIVQDTDIVINQNMDTSQVAAEIQFFDVHGCTEFYGILRYEADAIPQENNYAAFSESYSWTNCTFNIDIQEVQTTLPSCPIIWLENTADGVIILGTATHRMCPGAIAGLVVGMTAFTVAAVAALAVLQGALAAPAAMEYTTL